MTRVQPIIALILCIKLDKVLAARAVKGNVDILRQLRNRKPADESSCGSETSSCLYSRVQDLGENSLNLERGLDRAEASVTVARIVISRSNSTALNSSYPLIDLDRTMIVEGRRIVSSSLTKSRSVKSGVSLFDKS